MLFSREKLMTFHLVFLLLWLTFDVSVLTIVTRVLQRALKINLDYAMNLCESKVT